jgi:hypothetical protein
MPFGVRGLARRAIGASIPSGVRSGVISAGSVAGARPTSVGRRMGGRPGGRRGTATRPVAPTSMGPIGMSAPSLGRRFTGRPAAGTRMAEAVTDPRSRMQRMFPAGSRRRRGAQAVGGVVGAALVTNAVVGPRPPSSARNGLRPGGQQLPY